MHTIATARVNVAHGVRVDSIREAIVAVRKHLPVVQSFAIIGDVEAIDGRGRSEIVLAWEVVDSRVGDVNILEVGRNLDTVGRRESVGNRLDNTSIWLESIHLRLDGRCRPEVLPIPCLLYTSPSPRD